MTPSTEHTPGIEVPTPLPPRQFRWYLLFWHIVSLTLLAVLLGNSLRLAWPAWGWREAALAALVAGQAGLYFITFIRATRWPQPWWWMAVYFLGSIALWYLEVQLDEGFFWLLMSYFGQMFGTLPPVAAIPGTTLIYFYINGLANDWDFSNWSPGELLGVTTGWVSFIVVYWFIHHVMQTSSERAHLIGELQAAQAALEQARQRDAELAALRERERLARDLHDSLGHALVAISVQLEAIQRLYRVDADKASAQVEALKTLTRDSMGELRRSLEGLRAPGLGDQPLAEALQALAVTAGERTGLVVACRVTGPAAELPPAAAEALWRVAQEALTNVEKHAQARRVDLHLEVQPASATLTVADDGKGFPPNGSATAVGFGLQGMRERVEGRGGTLTFNSVQGARVEARVPRV